MNYNYKAANLACYMYFKEDIICDHCNGKNFKDEDIVVIHGISNITGKFEHYLLCRECFHKELVPQINPKYLGFCECGCGG